MPPTRSARARDSRKTSLERSNRYSAAPKLEDGERMLGEGHSIVRYCAPRKVHLGRSHVLCEAELAAVDMLNAYLAQTMR